MAPKAVGWAQDKDPFNVHVIQDVNTGIPPLRMKKAASGSVKSQSKRRRPLADISTTPNRPLSTNKQVPSSKKGVPNAKEVERKPLSDISNRGTASDSATSPGRLQIIPEEEGFLHNHKECTKTRDLVADKGFFLKTLCLDDNGISTPLVSPQRQKQEEVRGYGEVELSYIKGYVGGHFVAVGMGVFVLIGRVGPSISGRGPLAAGMPILNPDNMQCCQYMLLESGSVLQMKTASVEMDDPYLAMLQQIDGHDSPSFLSPGSPSLSPSGYWDEGTLPSFSMTLSPPALLSEDD